MKRGQVSTELLVIVALVLLIFIPLLVLVYFKANEANQQIATYQAELAVSRVASLANSVGSLGTNTSVVTDVYVPANTVYFKTVASGRAGEIVLRLRTPEGDKDTPDVIKYPIQNPGVIVDEDTAGGWMKIRITSVYVGTEAQVKIEKA
ncbi:MAG TPA: hypothetical protein VLD37_02050 [Candidatus Bilamarchaeum sp.]|nr:hypothetical protein [Candidatus Bilamarchaeum sp.]